MPPPTRARSDARAGPDDACRASATGPAPQPWHGKVNRAKVEVIWRTSPYPDYMWLAQPNLDKSFGKGFTTKLSKAIISWRTSDPEQKQILKLFGAQQFTQVNAAEYKQIEQVGRQIGKIR